MSHLVEEPPIATHIKYISIPGAFELIVHFKFTLQHCKLYLFQELNDPYYGPDLKALDLLKAYDKVMPRNRQRRTMFNDDDSDADNVNQTVPQGNPDLNISFKCHSCEQFTFLFY